MALPSPEPPANCDSCAGNTAELPHFDIGFVLLSSQPKTGRHNDTRQGVKNCSSQCGQVWDWKYVGTMTCNVATVDESGRKIAVDFVLPQAAGDGSGVRQPDGRRAGQVEVLPAPQPAKVEALDENFA